MADEDRLRDLLRRAADALYPSIILFLALKRQGLGSRAHKSAIETYEAIKKEIGE